MPCTFLKLSLRVYADRIQLESRLEPLLAIDRDRAAVDAAAETQEIEQVKEELALLHKKHDRSQAELEKHKVDAVLLRKELCRLREQLILSEELRKGNARRQVLLPSTKVQWRAMQIIANKLCRMLCNRSSCYGAKTRRWRTSGASTSTPSYRISILPKPMRMRTKQIL